MSNLLQRYAAMRQRSRVHERELFPRPRIPNELELQARWFAGEFGHQFVTVDGDRIEILQFGVWNREAGPDFREAAININGQVRKGSIEFELTDRSWEAHGHATNPAFEDVILHVFVEAGKERFFTRTFSNRAVPQLQVALEMLEAEAPRAVPLARPGRCQAPLAHLPEAHVTSVLEGAAHYRLQRKAERLRKLIETHGRDEALYQVIAAALGYKENQLPFTLLAQRATLRLLRSHEREAEAILFGVAGMLSASDFENYAGATRAYARDLWDQWWRQRDQFDALILPRALWRISSTRPVNHPQRRIAALAVLTGVWTEMVRQMSEGSLAVVEAGLLKLEHPYWSRHYTLSSAPAKKEMALIGETRTRDIIANVVIPFRLTQQQAIPPEFREMRAPLSNRRAETAATRLFGRDPRRRALTMKLINQQGLLQIYEDFCLQDDSDCANCPFPEQLQKWSQSARE